MDTLKKQWIDFSVIIFNPLALIFLIATLVFFLMSHFLPLETDKATSNLYTFLLSISSGITGAIISKKWSDIAEGTVLSTRGKSAVWSLKLLLNHIIQLENRIKYFYSFKDEEKKEPTIVNLNFEEAMSMCNILAGETTNSIQNWTDIVPEADVKSHNDAMNEMKAELEIKTNDLNELEVEYNEVLSESGEELVNAVEEQNKLKADVQEKEKEIARLSSELRREQSKFWAGSSGISVVASTVSGTTGSSGVSDTGGMIHRPLYLRDATLRAKRFKAGSVTPVRSDDLDTATPNTTDEEQEED
jgi:hypothetical protein